MDFKPVGFALALTLFSTLASAAEIEGVPFESQWALENKGQRICRFDGRNCQNGVVGVDTKARKAWAKNQDCRSVVVAVLDTGVDTRHPDLAANLVAGRNFVGERDTNNPADDHFHGTHVSGIIAGAGTESRGLAGVCRRAKLLPIKVGSAEGMLSDADVLQGIQHAVRQGAKVVNGSFGGGPSNQIIKQAIQRASGTLFVFAAGNGDFLGRGFDIDRQPVYPASYDLPNIVAVAASDNRDQLGDFSNFGVRSVHLAAPGVNILSAMPMRKTRAMESAGIPVEMAAIDGTSMATPYVAGAATLLWATLPAANPAEIKRRLMSSVDAVASLRGKVASGGRLNLAKLLGVR